MEPKWIEEFDPLDSSYILRSVRQCAEWIEQYRHETADGCYWDVQPGTDIAPDETLLARKSLYGGSAGIALFYLRVYKVTDELKWLELAEAAVDYMISTYEGTSVYDNAGSGTLAGIPNGLLNGPAGEGYVAWLIFHETGKQKYRAYAEKVTDDLISTIKKEASGSTWSGAIGIISDGGLILYLLKMYQAFGKPEYLETARSAGDYIASKAEKAPGAGVRWYAMDTVAFGLGKEGYFPGFFYGTAGCAYIMAALYEVCREERFLKLSKQGADYIKYIADKNDKKNAALVRYNDPYKNNLFYLGLCQGPVGTSRLFYKLCKITGEAEYKDWIIKLTNGILEAGAPQKHSSGYWHTYCYCCGSAGMLEHFLHIYDLTGEERYLKAATESTEVLLRDSYEEDGKRRWYTAWNRHLPGEVSAFTGLYVGTAGCASALLAYYNHQTENITLPEYIEDPYL